MKGWHWNHAAAIALLTVATSSPGADKKVERNTGATLYFQVIHGSDGDAAPTKGAKPIGSKLKGKLEKVFRWKNYWEVKRGELKVQEGKTAHATISERRHLEVSFAGKDGVDVSMFKDGKLARKTREKRSASFIIVGGEERERQSWFIILRRSKPSTTE